MQNLRGTKKGKLKPVCNVQCVIYRIYEFKNLRSFFIFNFFIFSFFSLSLFIDSRFLIIYNINIIFCVGASLLWITTFRTTIAVSTRLGAASEEKATCL